ncbi:hypothetical protein ABIB25_000930 [Nakamurella sp. UYEF19]|uniref:hypothetical protein n=1 Tax=Nakamurella sp. UYEF19 TaxID=1756392 RepID=UPI0033971099
MSELDDVDFGDLQITGDVVGPCLAAAAAAAQVRYAVAVWEQVTIWLATGDGTLAAWSPGQLNRALVAGRVRRWRSGDLPQTEIDLPVEQVAARIAALGHRVERQQPGRAPEAPHVAAADDRQGREWDAYQLLRLTFTGFSAAGRAHQNVMGFAAQVLRIAEVPWALIARKLGRSARWVKGEVLSDEYFERIGCGDDETARQRRTENVRTFLARFPTEPSWRVPMGYRSKACDAALQTVPDESPVPLRPAAWIDTSAEGRARREVFRAAVDAALRTATARAGQGQ